MKKTPLTLNDKEIKGYCGLYIQYIHVQLIMAVVPHTSGDQATIILEQSSFPAIQVPTEWLIKNNVEAGMYLVIPMAGEPYCINEEEFKNLKLA